MRICLISVEIFAWGKFGGFGKAARLIGRELARRGHELFAVVPRRAGQQAVETLDGIRVLGFAPSRPWDATALFAEADADIYHSCEPSTASWLAMRAMPGRRHVATVRDPRDLRDWAMELSRPSLNRAQVMHNWLYEGNPLVRRCIRRMDAVYATSPHLVGKVRRMYGLASDPVFLPTPVEVPDTVAKSPRPSVCCVARLDRRKRPERFLELAERFPEVAFTIVGKSRDPRYEASLRRTFGMLPNVRWEGFIDQFDGARHSQILSESWVFVNTATREGLPNAFLEAAAHGCAILSYVDPDGFATRFGRRAARDDFESGLGQLLAGDAWRERGAAGRRFVSETFELSHAMDLHEAAYRDVARP
jgi:glycosyltransferase involved in cell wall biosynthesis